MSVDVIRLKLIFQFLTLHRDWNRDFQNFEYRRSLAYCASEPNPEKARLHELLRGTAATQSQPRMGLLGPFWRSLHAFEANGMNSMDAFTAHLEATRSPPKVMKVAAGPLERLYLALKEQSGWGAKTSALFVKNVIRIHQGPAEFHFWKDALELSRGSIKNDRVYLPVDRVIEKLFSALDMQRPTFDKINKLLHEEYNSDEVIVWDDLWYWGFFTQIVMKDEESGNISTNDYMRERTMQWNTDKFWCQIAAEKECEQVLKDIAHDFIGLFSLKCRAQALP